MILVKSLMVRPDEAAYQIIFQFYTENLRAMLF